MLETETQREVREVREVSGELLSVLTLVDGAKNHLVWCDGGRQRREGQLLLLVSLWVTLAYQNI